MAVTVVAARAVAKGHTPFDGLSQWAAGGVPRTVDPAHWRHMIAGTPMAPRYRADHVGSLLRPPELLQAREDHRDGRITAEQLRDAEDAAVLQALELQRSVG